MPPSVSNNPVAGSFHVSAAAAAQRHSAPLAVNGQGAAVQSQPARLTLPARSNSLLERQRAELQQRQMVDSNRQSALFDHLALRNGDAQSVSDNGTEIQRMSTFNGTEVERLSSVSAQSAPHVNGQDLKAERKQHARLGLDLNNLRENAEKAKTVGVDVAKKTFWTKLAGVAVSTLAAGALVGLAVATGGVALGVAAGIAGVMLAKQAADTRCAYQVLKNERAEAQGQEKPYKNVPMGADWVANKMYAAIGALKPGMSEEAKMRAAGNISKGLNLTLSVAQLASGGVIGALQGHSLLLTALPAAINVANVGAMYLLSRGTDHAKEQTRLHGDDQLVNRFMEVNDLYRENMGDIVDRNNLSEQEFADKQIALMAGLVNLERDVDTLAQRKEHNDLAFYRANNERTDEEDVAYVKALGDFEQDSLLVAAYKNQHGVAEMEAQEADQASTAAAKKAGVHDGLHMVGHVLIEKSVEKGIEKILEAKGHAHVEVDSSLTALLTTGVMIKKAFDYSKAVKELNQVREPVTKHEQNIAQINRQFDYII